MKDIELDFTIGGFKGSKRVWWNGRKLCAFNFEHFYGGKDCPIQSDFVPTISKSIRKLGWTKFWSQMDIIEVWSWDKVYINQNMFDGTQWELLINKKGRRKRRIYGSNLYPKPTKKFKELIYGINNLLEKEFLFSC